MDHYPIPSECLYCQSDVVFTSNATIYGKAYGNGKCYKCVICDAYVGVHNGTTIPLGRMANKELRELKKQAHALFDPIWQNKQKTRSEAYQDLAKALDIPINECHFGWFDQAMLLRAIEVLQPKETYQKKLVEIIQYLQKDLTLTNEWGLTFIQGIMKAVREKGGLTPKQIAQFNKQYVMIVKNAEKRKITI